MNLIDKDALCKILMSIMDEKAECEYTRGWNDGLFEAIHHAETLAEAREQGCDLCANPRCDNCTNAGRFLICAYIKTGEICIQHHATNYCGNCGRKLVE